ncbi:MAG: SpoIID/LytB domain-containing protein [Candidatus Omnitrophica bacterium]|nr:SpoIID/LytB domain-containing protein [Candidatus Omnitrophota bacterium]
MFEHRSFKLALVLIAVLLALVMFFGPFGGRQVSREPFLVRVRVAHDADTVLISARGQAQIKEMGTGDILLERTEVAEGTEVKASSRGIKFADKTFFTEAIRVIPQEGDALRLNGVVYRGQMDIIRTGSGIDAVNRVEIEDYLKGVLSKEVHHFWPFAALKAQAIASRSYAVSKARRRKNKYYDLTADTYTQVYGGRSCEKWRTNRAVNATRGKVLEYEGKILPAYFHSCCGGKTENAAVIWGEDLAPLRGVRCPWCRWSPYFRWQERVPVKTIAEKLRDKGYQVNRIDDIRPGERDRSGRLKYVRIRTRNKWFEISTGHFRSAIGRRTLKSANFRVKKYPTFYLFSGYGWGHGVGMCQWGAFGLALRWKSAEWILRHYYPGSKIVQLGQLD